jgi:hypothetical protein
MDETTAPSRNSKRPKHVLVGLLVLLLVGVVLFFAARPSAPGRISVRYLGRIDQPGNTRLTLAITNVGTSLVFTSAYTEIESNGSSNQFRVGTKMSRDRLRPGEGFVTDCMLSTEAVPALDKRWRVTCYFGRNGIRSWISVWQWGRNGPGPKVNWLVPNFLKGMPLTVIGTSDWNDPVPASSNVR